MTEIIVQFTKAVAHYANCIPVHKAQMMVKSHCEVVEKVSHRAEKKDRY